MAYGASITWDAGTINLNDGTNYRLLEFTPTCNPISTDSVVDTMKIKIYGTSFAAAQSALQAVNKAFLYAGEYQRTHSGSKYYLNYAPDGLTSYRSEIIGFGDGLSRIEMESDYQPNWTQNKAIFGNVLVNRRNYWEQSTYNTATLQSNNGTETTLKVYNSNDANGTAPSARYAYVDVPGTLLAGDLPGAMWLQYQNMGGTALSRLFVYNSIAQTTAYNPNIETSVFALGTSIGTADFTNYSGGTARTFGIGTTLAVFAKGTITPSTPIPEMMNIVLCQTSGGTSDIQIQAQLISNNGTLLVGPIQQMTSDYVQSLGYMRIPPIDMVGAGWSSTPLELWFYGKSSTVRNLVIDNLWLMPTSGGHRIYDVIGTTLGTAIVTTTPCMINDAEEFVATFNSVFMSGNSSSFFYNIQAIGAPILLQPGINNRLWFVRNDADGRNPGAIGQVNINYRPRRLLI